MARTRTGAKPAKPREYIDRAFARSTPSMGDQIVADAVKAVHSRSERNDIIEGCHQLTFRQSSQQNSGGRRLLQNHTQWTRHHAMGRQYILGHGAFDRT